MVNRLQVGAITSTHGIKGEVKVFPTTDDPKRFEALKQVFLETPKGDMELEIEDCIEWKKAMDKVFGEVREGYYLW